MTECNCMEYKCLKKHKCSTCKKYQKKGSFRQKGKTQKRNKACNTCLNKSNNKRSNNKKSNKLSREDSIQTSKDDTFINSTNINEIDSDSSSQNTIPKNKHSNKKSRPKMAADK